MPYPKCKIYSDRSHYIAIPHTERPYKPRKKPKEEAALPTKESLQEEQEGYDEEEQTYQEEVLEGLIYRVLRQFFNIVLCTLNQKVVNHCMVSNCDIVIFCYP